MRAMVMASILIPSGVWQLAPRSHAPAGYHGQQSLWHCTAATQTYQMIYSCHRHSTYSIDHAATYAGGACKISSQSTQSTQSDQNVVKLVKSIDPTQHSSHMTTYLLQPHLSVRQAEMKVYSRNFPIIGPHTQRALESQSGWISCCWWYQPEEVGHTIHPYWFCHVILNS